MTGTVFNIQRFCVNDGPGIRTTVFLKGCPLRCKWCHNPESHIIAHEMFFNEEKCVRCGACEQVCPEYAHTVNSELHIFDRKKCKKCGKCAEYCPTKALESVGTEETVDQVLAEVLKDKVFYENSSGGMTLSGGEPLFQADFAIELLKNAKENGLHTCIETCGFADEKIIFEAAKYTDIFLYDIKLTDNELHRKYTGVGNEKILINLKKLDDFGCKTILRCPIIPTVNDNEEHFKGIAEIANNLKNNLEINIEPYHPLGTSKLKNLGKDDTNSAFLMPKNTEVGEWINIIKKYTNVKTVRS